MIMSNFAQERLEICNACPYNENMECLICGCPLGGDNSKLAKPEEFCPLSPGSKWGPYIEASKAAPIIAAPTETAPVNPPRPPCRTCGGRTR